MKYLIIGLGNPGDKYLNTRHNIGFKILDKIISLEKTSFSTEKLVEYAEVKYRSRTLILIKPNTFMNLSGKAVLYWMKKVKVKEDNILVISDDIALPFGTLRIKSKGSNGGHNGLKDIEKFLGYTTYPRLRFGVGNNFSKGRQAEYVLSDFSEDENKTLNDKIESSIDIIYSFVAKGIVRTMSDFNGK